MGKLGIFRRLGFKIAFLTSIVGLMPLFVGLPFLFKSTESIIEDNVFNNLESTAQNIKDEICRFINNSVNEMRILAEAENMRDMDISADKKLLEMKRIQKYYRRFDDITLVDTKGRVITSTTYAYRGKWKAKKWFQEAIEGNVYISDAHIISEPYKVVVMIAVPLIDIRGKIRAAIIGQLNMERIWEILDNITKGNTRFVTIINEQNYIIAHPNKEILFQPLPFDIEKRSGIVGAGEQDSPMVLYGKDKYGFYSEFTLPRWQFIVAQEKKEALSVISGLKNNVLYIFVVSLFLVVLTSILISRYILKPVRTLVDGMAKVSAGDLSYKLHIKSRDEIGLLGVSFNEMIANLHKSRQELQSRTDALHDALHSISLLNITLENKVEERTKALLEKQQQLIQTGRLAAIGQLGAGVAHELNNPIAGILGYTQFMLDILSKDNLKIENVHIFRKYLLHIENGARRCKDIILGLLQFVRKSPEECISLNVNDVLEDTLFLIERQLLVNKVMVIKKIAEDIHLIDGNPAQLQQVFTNIIINAQQAMPEGGQLFISTRNENENVIIEFKDTGCGISEEYKDRIFEPFFTTKMNWKGTGLGLSICYDIIKNHNGNIVVNNQLEKGAVFSLILPVKGNKDGQYKGYA